MRQAMIAKMPGKAIRQKYQSDPIEDDSRATTIEPRINDPAERIPEKWAHVDF